MKNEQLIVNNENKEQRAGSKEQSKDYSKIARLPLLIALCSLLISCDLFNGPIQPDFIGKIDAEIAWANAARLNVRVEYPSGWGTSSPSTGQISPSPMDIRQGYAFDVEFTPDPAYSFLGWRVYETEALNALNTEGSNWRTNLNLLDDVEPLGAGVAVPELLARGGRGSFTINTTTPVTLVPWCKTEPYVTRTEPRNEGESGSGSGVHPSTPIVVYFNSALKANQNLAFGAGRVEIKGRQGTSGAWTDYSGRFETPVYDAKFGQNFVTIVPRTGTNALQAGWQIQVTIGPGILNAEEEPMSREEVFYYRVSSSTGGNASVSGWSATYNETAGTITVTCNLAGANASSAPLTAYYQMNQGASQPITLNTSGATRTGAITGVGGLDFSGVREGRQVSGTREYRIFIELDAGGSMVYDNFKIWNFPGMSVSTANPAIELTSASGLSAISANLAGQYVLANDISVTGTHTPIGTGSDTAAFTGKFYGNGHTVTINSMNTAADMGLFGIANNATVRDLTVDYANITVTATVISNIGGIAGQANGTTEILNCIVRTGNLSVSSANDVYAGGIVGRMHATARIDNCYSGINLSVTGTDNGVIRTGGIAGQINNQSVLSTKMMVSKVRATGNVSVKNTTTSTTSTGSIYLGGIAGETLGLGTIQDAYVSGTLSMSASNTNTSTGLNYICGGIIGRMQDGHLVSSEFVGKIDIPSSHNVNRTTFIGGVVGIAGMPYQGSGTNNAQITVTRSTARGDIYLDVTGTGQLNLGGVCAAPRGENNTNRNIVFTECEYRDGVISIDSKNSGAGNIGGFAGEIVQNTEFVRCNTKAGLVRVVYAPSGSAEMSIGGFIGQTRGDISGCYTNSPIEVDIKTGTTATLNVGGFVGIFVNGIDGYTGTPAISGCFAGGSVTVNTSNSAGGTLRTGGFAGFLRGTVSVRDSYALGAVLVNKNDSTAGALYTGGFAGRIELTNTANTIERCFSAGSVVSQFNNATTALTNYAGGIAGYRSGGTFRNCAALGGFVAVQGPSLDTNRVAGRIFGYSTAANISNNFAAQSMLLINDIYGRLNPPNAPVSGDGDGADKNGLTVGAAMLQMQSFWTTGPGFSGATWNFSGLTGRGYPTLVGVGNQ